MALPRAFRNISLILFVIVIKCQTSTTRANDDDNEDTSEEYIEPRTRRSGSSSSALFSTVATMRARLRPPRALDNTNGCGKPQPDPCPSRMPVCTGSEGNYRVYENECEVYKVRCDGREPIIDADPRSCQLESCGEPQPNPCPRRVPVCAGYPGDYRIYEDECQLNETRCSRQGNDLEPIHTTTIGKCQKEDKNATQLTCYEILRGKCPLGTIGQQVCDVKAKPRKTYRNICRALHKRCKKQDDTCYHVDVSCKSYNATESTYGTNPPKQDCSRFIRQSFPILDVGKPCYNLSASRRNCTCKADVPAIPNFPPIRSPSAVSIA
ncbi:uncharacterized protein LOC100891187 isoform X2 [Strongylocentrotus purpuratus]|uniref:Agrin n=1 Tax=Strongylocentrotus purpuratus TaxID=7668 RepID=A0A7M7MYS7_STRPU|nr:uncharacterized protein LOC100891187 isoform X2 [Strongylocentrotus purpuratus]